MAITVNNISMATALLLLIIGLLEAAPMPGKTAAEEMELANLIKDAKDSKSQATDSNNMLSKDNMPQTKVLLQKTRIVIPVDDEKDKATPAPVAPEVPAVPEVQKPVAPQQFIQEPVQFAAPPQQPINPGFSEEENSFLFPADYELHSQDPVYQTYDDEPVMDESPDLDLTPRAVAEYLLLTGDFRGFDEALTDLLNAGLLTLPQVEQYRFVVGQEYERMMSDVATAEAEYEQEQQLQQQLYDSAARPTEYEIRDQLNRDAEAGQLLQALLQDYLNTENMNINTQEYEDFLDWMEKSLNDNEVEPAAAAQEISPEAAQEIKEEQLPEIESEVEQELESLPVEEEDGSGSIEEAENLFTPNQLSSTEKKLKKAIEADKH